MDTLGCPAIGFARACATVLQMRTSASVGLKTLGAYLYAWRMGTNISSVKRPHRYAGPYLHGSDEGSRNRQGLPWVWQPALRGDGLANTRSWCRSPVY